MKQLPVRARWYVLAVSAAGLILVCLASLTLPGERPETLLFALLLAAVYGAAELWRLVIPRKAGDQPDFSLATAVAIWAALALGPAMTVCAVGMGYLLSMLHQRRAGKPWFKYMFNMAQLVMSYGASSWVYHVIADPAEPVLGSVRNVLAFLPVFVVYYALNTGFVTMVLALVRDEPVFEVWRQHYRDTALIDLAMVPAGAMFVLLWGISPFALLLAGLPLYVVQKCFDYIRQMHEQTKKSLFALSRTLDQRDSATYHHSETVAAYSRVIGERLNLPPSEVELIVEAARLHDIGKIGVPDSILLKPGPLTAEERREVEKHPEIGEQMIMSFSVFEEGARLIRHHHERYDGKGYPDSLAGNSIPIGARIICVTDSFEAMTADRPYRAGMSMEVAVDRLIEGAGTQFDARVVDIMVQWLVESRGITPRGTPAAPRVAEAALRGGAVASSAPQAATA